MPAMRVSYSRDEFMALKEKAQEANLPSCLTNPEYLSEDGIFVPDKYVEGLWKNERGTKKRTDIPEAFQNGSTLSPQRRAFSGGCKESSNGKGAQTSDGDNLRRRALNNNLSSAPSLSQKSSKNKILGSNGTKLNQNTIFGRQKPKREEREEAIPEWMDEGPTDHNEVIALGGFDDDNSFKKKPQKKSVNVLDLLNAEKNKTEFLPESDLEFAAQFGILDVLSSNEVPKPSEPQAPQQSRLARFFDKKNEEKRDQQQLPASVAMLLQGGSKSIAQEEKKPQPRALDESTLLAYFSRSERQQQPPQIQKEEVNGAEDDLEEFKKILLDDFMLPTTERPPRPITPIPHVELVDPPPSQAQFQPPLPQPAAPAPSTNSSVPRSPQMSSNQMPAPPQFPQGFPLLHPSIIQHFQAEMAAGRINLNNPQQKAMAEHIKMQLAVMSNPAAQQFVSMMPGSSGQPPFMPPSQHKVTPPSSVKTTRPAFADLVPTAVMRQRSAQPKEETEGSSHNNNDKSRSGSANSNPQPQRRTPVELEPSQSAVPPSNAGQVPPPFMPPHPSMNHPMMPSGPMFAQMGMPFGFPLPSPFAMAMDQKNLQEAQKRGDMAYVSFFQNRINTQMQMLATLQQQQRNAFNANGGNRQDPGGNVQGTGPPQGSGRSTGPSTPAPLHLRPQSDFASIPSVFQQFNHLHDKQANLNILNKLPPHVRPMTVEELERQLASS